MRERYTKDTKTKNVPFKLSLPGSALHSLTEYTLQNNSDPHLLRMWRNLESCVVLMDMLLHLCSSLFCLVSDHWLAILLNCATYGQGCALIYVCMLAIKIHLHKQTIHWATLFIELRRLFLLSIPPGRQMRTQNSLLMSDCSNLELLIWSDISECWFAIERPTSTSTLTSAWKSNLVRELVTGVFRHEAPGLRIF